MTGPAVVVVDHLAGARLGERQEFARGPRLRFGRHPANDVAFDAQRDLDASARHAELREEDGGLWLVDVGSSNGTWIGGERVVRHPVVPGEVVEVEFGPGGPRCRLFVGEREAAPLPPTILAPPSPRGGPGPRTVAMMVQHAVAAAQERPGLGRSTRFVQSMVDQALHRSTRRFRLVLAGLVAAFVLAMAGLLLWNARTERRSRHAREELERRLEQQRRDERIREGAILDARRDAERLMKEGPGPRIVRENYDAVYLLAFVEPDGVTERAFCTAFAVAPRHLATNAHCVVEINRLRGEGRSIGAVRNGDPARRLGVASMAMHRGFSGSRAQVSVDVALLEVDADLPSPVRLADRARLERLATGARMFTYGFPARLADPRRPEATLTEGVVGRLTRLTGDVGPFEENVLVQHDAFTTGGTSGSPVLDADGVVVALNAGGYLGEQPQVVVDPASGGTKVVDVGATLSGYNYAIRIDALQAMMRDKGVGAGEATGGAVR